MTMSPGTPFAGSNVSFVATGLQPWDVVEVTFFEPSGEKAGWIGDDHYTRSWATNYFLANEDGSARWVRYGAQDQVGDWSAQVKIDDSLRIINYSYTKFELPRLVSVRLGVPLYGCRSDEATIFFSDSVNFSVTVDMHANLKFTADLLEDRLGVRTAEIPVIYMLGNQADFESAERAAGIKPGWEGGFFLSYGEYQGIFIQSDKQKTPLYHTLTHEYVHFLLDEIAQGKELPAWLNEGLAGYYEFEVGSHGDLPDASYTRMLWSADLTQTAETEGRLFLLSQLESQQDWNNRAAPLVSLQYAQSHMAVRYLSERYGESASIKIVQQISMGETLDAAIQTVTGVGYPQIESDFTAWLTAWDDPDRAATRPYLEVMDELADEQAAIRELREELIKEWNLHFNRVTAEEKGTALQERSKALVERADGLQPPEFVADLHEAATAYFHILDAWLSDDLAFFSTYSQSRRLAANAMIPEVNYRKVDFGQRLDDAKYTLRLWD